MRERAGIRIETTNGGLTPSFLQIPVEPNARFRGPHTAWILALCTMLSSVGIAGDGSMRRRGNTRV